MYDLNWARQVWADFRKLTPRGEQIDRCLVQLAAEAGFSFSLTPSKIRVACLRAIRDKHYGETWRRYKRLCRKTPFDEALATTLAKALCYLWQIQDDDARQLYLDWSLDGINLYDETT